MMLPKQSPCDIWHTLMLGLMQVFEGREFLCPVIILFFSSGISVVIMQFIITVKCLSIGTPKNNKIFIFSKCKIAYF